MFSEAYSAISAQQLFANGPLKVEYTYLGKEAGDTNSFLVLGNLQFSTAGSGYGDTASETLSLAGLLNFAFGANQATPTVTNGSNPAGGTGVPNFFISFYDKYGKSGCSERQLRRHCFRRRGQTGRR